MTVAAVLKQKGGAVITVPPAATVPEIAQIISSQRIGAVVVTRPDGSLAGIVSERDVVKAIAERGGGAMALTAEDIMTRQVTTATLNTTMDEAMDIMDAGYFRHLPVVDAGSLIGIISIRDVVKMHIQHQALEVDSLKSYVYRGSPRPAASPDCAGSDRADCAGPCPASGDEGHHAKRRHGDHATQGQAYEPEGDTLKNQIFHGRPHILRKCHKSKTLSPLPTSLTDGICMRMRWPP